ncbi:MAG: superoxide dismutase [Ni] [Calditrichia bacterium]
MKTQLNRFVLIFPVVLLAGLIINAYSHCQIPCGIYGDQMRFDMMLEDLQTVEKSMKQIEEISKSAPVNYNQLVRWVNNKEEHAQKIQDIITQYFLAQRVKPAQPGSPEFEEYQKKLVLLHQIHFYTMKAKQSTDLAVVSQIRDLIEQFHNIYFSPEDKKHLQEHK